MGCSSVGVSQRRIALPDATGGLPDGRREYCLEVVRTSILDRHDLDPSSTSGGLKHPILVRPLLVYPSPATGAVRTVTARLVRAASRANLMGFPRRLRSQGESGPGRP